MMTGVYLMKHIEVLLGEIDKCLDTPSTMTEVEYLNQLRTNIEIGKAITEKLVEYTKHQAKLKKKYGDIDISTKSPQIYKRKYKLVEEGYLEQ